MYRVQFFPDQSLLAALENDAASKGVSKSTLVTDILNEFYGLNDSASSVTDLTDKVLKEVESYISTCPVDHIFDLNMASETYRGITMASFNKPKTVRASIGRSFASKIGKDQFKGIEKAYVVDRNGNLKEKLSVNNALMYVKKA